MSELGYCPIDKRVYECARNMRDYDPEGAWRLLFACCSYFFDAELPELGKLDGAVFREWAKPYLDSAIAISELQGAGE